MFRSALAMLAAASLLLAAFGCDKKPQRPADDTPAETGPTPDKPDAETPPAQGGPDVDPPSDDQQPDARTDTTRDDQPQACPEARDYQGMCAQVITWALNPDTADCCRYGSPCEAPEDWRTFSSEGECVQAGGSAEN